MKMFSKTLFAICTSLSLLASGWAEDSATPPGTPHGKADPATPAYKPVKGEMSGSVLSVGTDTMEALMKLWIDGFEKHYPNVKMSQEAKGSMTAEPALTEGRAQLAPLSRELMPDEMARFKKKLGYEPLVVKVALGSYNTPTKTVALTFYVHESNPVKKLTFEQIDAMYCTGRKRGHKEDITKWGQVGATGEWADRPIKLVGVMQPDGISNYIRLLICNDGELKPGILEEKIDHSEGAVSVLTRIVKDVEQDPTAIGYAGFHNRQPHSKPVALAETDKGPFLMGTFPEVASARFALTRYIYILVNKDPGKPLDPTVKEFLKYTLSREGQQAVEKEGVFLPLPARIAKQELARLN